MVLVMKPKLIGGHKTQTYWVGPTTIISRSGQNNFTIITKEGDSREVHAAQLKPYYDDVLEGGAPLHFYRPDYREPASGTPLVDEVLTHKTDSDGQLYFQIRWFGSDSRNDSWASVRELLEINDHKWASYCTSNVINSIPVSAMISRTSAEPLFG